jgi:nitrite reductase/ring-hydroxylating ferredoxin subunit
VVIRGAIAFGLLGAGLSVGGCGDDAAPAADAAPTPDVEGPAPNPVRAAGTAPPRGGRPQSKSDTYSRGPESYGGRHAPSPTPEPAATPGPAAGNGSAAGPASGSRPNDLATARQPGGTSGRPTVSPSPEPLPSGAFARTSDIPVGGGRTYKEQKVVVTQPSAGTFKGFSATCTHQGCLVDKVQDGRIVCPCHGSQYSIADGKVEKGPALLPLPAQQLAIDPNGNISKG